MFFGAGGRGKGMSKRRTPQDKARIVLEFLNTSTSATELRRNRNASLATFQDWKDKFMEGEKQVLSNAGGKVQGSRLRTDNGQQHISHKFREAVQVPGIWQEYIWKHASEQNGQSLST